MTSRLDDWTSAGPLEPGYFFGATSPKANRNWIWPNRQKVGYKRKKYRKEFHWLFQGIKVINPCLYFYLKCNIVFLQIEIYFFVDLNIF